MMKMPSKNGKPLTKKKKITQLFSPDFMEKLKENRFCGRLVVSWDEGELTYCRLSSKIEFRSSKAGDDDFGFGFYDFGDE